MTSRWTIPVSVLVAGLLFWGLLSMIREPEPERGPEPIEDEKLEEPAFVEPQEEDGKKTVSVPVRKEPPGLSVENRKIYENAIQTLQVNPREIGELAEQFISDPGTWKSTMKYTAEHDPADRMRGFATMVLIQYEDPSLESFFQKRLTEDHSWAPRRNCAEGLGNLPAISQKSKELLRKVVESDPHREVRQVARDALNRH